MKVDPSEVSSEGLMITLIFSQQTLVKHISVSGGNPGKGSEWEVGVLRESCAAFTVENTKVPTAGEL